MEIIFTKENHWLAKWDNFVQTENKASHLLLSDWNKSFESYGFEYEVCICLENGQIVGGFSAVVAKAVIFRFYIVPFGPIVSLSYENYLETLVSKVSERANYFNCCYCHISIPFSNVKNSHVYSQLPDLSVLNSATKGHLFKYVYSSNGMNWIDLKDFDEESKMMTLKPSVRRNIRNSYRKDLVFKLMTTDNEIEKAYNLFKENSIAANYSIREWKEIQETLVQLNRKGFIKMLAAFKEDELKGAILLVKGGNYYTYILGGSKKEVPDLRTGDFLQWEAIKLAIQEGLDGYNISLGGSKGVVEFKNSFNTEQLYYDNGQYHWVLKPLYFKLYLFFEKKLKPHKKTISKVLSKLKR
jgi:lipid II:glycine glycyltransferase (peptidoglycan interpeptide bridge formation enzyme)